MSQNSAHRGNGRAGAAGTQSNSVPRRPIVRNGRGVMAAPARGESVVRTVVVAGAVALVCSVLVSTAVYLLRPIQEGYALLERNRAVVLTAGTVAPGATDRQVVTAFLELEARVLDLDAARPVDDVDPVTYDHWNTTDPDYQRRPIAADADIAGLGVRPALVPVFARTGEAGVDRLVLPVHGKGMWSTLYGYVALAADLNTVEGLVIYSHGETPGIGNRIEDPAWLMAWRGKRIYDEHGDLAIRVIRRAPPGSAHDVDVISGASVTSGAVGNMVRYWMSEDGYRPWLRRLAAEGGADAAFADPDAAVARPETGS